MTIKHSVRKLINKFGFDLIRKNQSPQLTMLGLSNLNIHTIIDCGANKGQFAKLSSDLFPLAKLFCFEPMEAAFEELNLWAKTQNKRVHCFKFALGDVDGEIEMYLHDEHSQSSSILTTTSHAHQIYPQTKKQSIKKVRLSTLDNALNPYLREMPQNILLKLDVQGYEDRVLRGGIEILKKASACILEISLESLYEGQADFYQLTSYLSEMNYAYAGNLDQIYGSDGQVIFFDALYIKKDAKKNNEEIHKKTFTKK